MIRIFQQLSPEQQNKVKECNNRFHSLVKDVIILMENTRITYGYTQTDFANLLGLSLHRYTRFMRKLTADDLIGAIFKFCYIFGYDLQSLNKTSMSAKDVDTALLETASAFSSLPDDIIKELIELIEESKEMRRPDKRRAIEALSLYTSVRSQFLHDLENKDFTDIPPEDDEHAAKSSDDDEPADETENTDSN